ncbi:MAG TPA: DUF3761 domain-containing protein [Candidatus Saccharimonadales bacterium]|nr:DUF3761 domain-containing protein [Candidatus Saccharimonadales bacterium]
MGFIEKLKKDRKFLGIAVCSLIGIFIIPYLVIPTLFLLWFYKTKKFSKRFKKNATASVLGAFLLLVGWVSVLYAKDVDPHLTVTEPATTSTTKASQIIIKGTYSPSDRTIEINGQTIPTNHGSFETVHQLKAGENKIDVQAGEWKWTYVYLTVTREVPVIKKIITITPTAQLTAIPTSTQQPTPTYKVIPVITSTPIIYVAPTQQTMQSSQPTATQDQGLSNNNYYTNSSGNTVHSPAYSNGGSVPAGATAQCKDGIYSFSQHRSGTCSGHGGVSQWY